MAIDPIKIPQNVYIEDRIVGPLTLRQIIIVIIGGGFSYALFSAISKAYGAVSLPIDVLVWSPAVVAAMFAFVRVNDLSMMRLCLLFVERMGKPSTRAWAPRRGIIINIRTFSTPTKEEQRSPAAALIEKKRQNIAELSTVLDQPTSETPEAEDDLSPATETPESAAADAAAIERTNARLRPVNPERISATPLDGPPIDGVAGNGSVSIFRDISNTPHA